jgi:hypothetical protein
MAKEYRAFVELCKIQNKWLGARLERGLDIQKQIFDSMGKDPKWNSEQHQLEQGDLGCYGAYQRMDNKGLPSFPLFKDFQTFIQAGQIATYTSEAPALAGLDAQSHSD